MKIHLKGNWASKQVWLNMELVRPSRSIRVFSHSPDGFNWGYGGSGPAQLSLGLALELYPTQKDAMEKYHNLMLLVSQLPQGDFSDIYDLEI